MASGDVNIHLSEKHRDTSCFYGLLNVYFRFSLRPSDTEIEGSGKPLSQLLENPELHQGAAKKTKPLYSQRLVTDLPVWSYDFRLFPDQLPPEREEASEQPCLQPGDHRQSLSQTRWRR